MDDQTETTQEVVIDKSQMVATTTLHIFHSDGGVSQTCEATACLAIAKDMYRTLVKTYKGFAYEVVEELKVNEYHHVDNIAKLKHDEDEEGYIQIRMLYDIRPPAPAE